ncbi:hypothetical protein llap_8067 [Limosa lapponica baueri]|uniref:Uncharacterized protein n=1 Tax=Limosa lapponica baueri TaxID=1758121 RepID=A0A2I0U6H5_LIMLA|nr:hypothetical protein llap_8067 [Limosa lapponica baueri]
MGKARQMSQDIPDIPCPILIDSAEADSEKLKSDVYHIDRLVLNEILKKIHYGNIECVGIPLMDKDILKPPHAHAILMFEDGNREVMKTWCKGKIGDVVGAMASRLQCSQAYSEDVWISLFSP